MNSESAPPSFRKESRQWPCSSAARIARRNGARATECLPGVRAKEESKWGTHSGGSTGRCETVSPGSSLPNRDASRPQPERQLSLSAYCPAARIRAPAGREGASVVAPVGYRQFHLETANLGLPARSGRSSG